MKIYFKESPCSCNDLAHEKIGSIYSLAKDDPNVLNAAINYLREKGGK